MPVSRTNIDVETTHVYPPVDEIIKHRAALTVVEAAADVDDARHLLGMLGLLPEDPNPEPPVQTRTSPPPFCRWCGRPMRPRKTKIADHPGTVQHQGHGVCHSCSERARRTAKQKAKVIVPERCLDCGQPMVPKAQRTPSQRYHHARGLCRACWSRHYRADALDSWPTLTNQTGRHGKPVGECASCGEHRTFTGRGLCSGCHRREQDAGTLHIWPTVIDRRRAEFIEDVMDLDDHPPEVVADMLNTSVAAIARRLNRAGLDKLARRFYRQVRKEAA